MPSMGWGGHSSTGPVRATNEDGWRISPIPGWGLVAVVCDGMGGSCSAEPHAALAVTMFTHHIFCLPPEERLTEAAFRGACAAVNDAIGDHNDRYATAGSGVTLAAAVIHERRACVGWVGDCRIWRMTDTALTVVSREHLLVNRLIASGKLTAEEAKDSPYRNIILRHLGGSRDEHSVPDVAMLDLAPQEALLLATDGLWRQLPEERIHDRFSGHRALPVVAEQLIDDAHACDGTDNATLVIVCP